MHLCTVYSGESHVNVGSGEEIAILDLARLVAATVGFRGPILCDLSKPDGTPRKLMSVEKLHKLGWFPSIALPDGVASVYRWFVEGLQRTDPVEAV